MFVRCWYFSSYEFVLLFSLNSLPFWLFIHVDIFSFFTCNAFWFYNLYEIYSVSLSSVRSCIIASSMHLEAAIIHILIWLFINILSDSLFHIYVLNNFLSFSHYFSSPTRVPFFPRVPFFTFLLTLSLNERAAFQKETLAYKYSKLNIPIMLSTLIGKCQAHASQLNVSDMVTAFDKSNAWPCRLDPVRNTSMLTKPVLSGGLQFSLP